MNNVVQKFLSSVANVYTLTDTPVASSINVVVDGLNQSVGIDYLYTIDNQIEYFGTPFKDMIVSYDVEQIYVAIMDVAPDRETTYATPSGLLPAGPNVLVVPSPETQSSTNTLREMLKVYNAVPNPDSPILGLLTYGTNNVPILTERPPIPPELCEYRPSNVSVYDLDLPVGPPTIQYADANGVSLTSLDTSLYPPDFCISGSVVRNGTYAQPGDLNYAACGVPERVIDLYNSTWLASIGGAGTSGGGGSQCTGNETGAPKDFPNGAKQSAKISSASIKGGKISFSYSGINGSWPEETGAKTVNGIMFINKSKFDWLGKGQTSKTLSNIYGCYHGWKKPKNGESVTFEMCSIDKKQKTNSYTTTWYD